MTVTELENLEAEAIRGNIIPKILVTDSNVVFTEGHPPYAMVMGGTTRVEAPTVTREDIDNFVRATAPAEGIAQLAALVGKTREDYEPGKPWDAIQYSISTPEYSYRAHYKLSLSGATLTIRRIPKPPVTPVTAVNNPNILVIS